MALARDAPDQAFEFDLQDWLTVPVSHGKVKNQSDAMVST